MKTALLLSLRHSLFAAAVLLLAFAAGHADAATAHYSVKVTGQGAPVFFIPGLGCSGEVWSETVKSLVPTHACHVFTLAGFAGQPPVEGEFLATMEEALGNYLAAHASPKPTLVGHSLGGLLAVKLAARFPDLVAGVVVIDSLPFYAGAQPGATPESARLFAAGLRTTLEKQPRDVFLAGIRQGLPMMVTGDGPQAVVLGWMEASDQGTVARAMTDIIATDARADVGRVACPLLLVEAGAAPGAVPTELYAQQYAGARALTRVRVSDAKHFVMLDQPERFLGELRKFIPKQP